jgi:hypothetical protein
MKLSQLAAKPQLIKLTLADEDTVEKYGEPIEFYVQDRQNMETYLKLSQLDPKDIAGIANTVVPLILNEDGSQMIDPQGVLPIDVLVKTVEAVVISLGNPQSQTTAA